MSYKGGFLLRLLTVVVCERCYFCPISFGSVMTVTISYNVVFSFEKMFPFVFHLWFFLVGL